MGEIRSSNQKKIRVCCAVLFCDVVMLCCAVLSCMEVWENSMVAAAPLLQVKVEADEVEQLVLSAVVAFQLIGRVIPLRCLDQCLRMGKVVAKEGSI